MRAFVIKWRRRLVQSPVEPQTPRATRSKPATGGTPKTPLTARKMPQSKKKSIKQADDDDSDVVEITKPSNGPSTKSKSKGKGHPSVTLLDAPIKMPASNSKNLSAPIADPEYNPFVTVSGDEMEIDEPVEDDVHSSPRKKVKTMSGEAKPAKAAPAKKKKEHDPVTDTPVTGMSKKMAKSFIASDDEDNMTPEPETSTSLEMVSDPDNPEHARFMCKYMKPSYRAPHAPPLITVAHTVLLCPDHDNTPLSFVTIPECNEEESSQSRMLHLRRL
ncbi:hypothetical protein BC629DRAFT_1595800 [Irpex lacteus]|nr:hypothetical protein BC629DRAFT_1595800 [Irpex lacteus]